MENIKEILRVSELTKSYYDATGKLDILRGVDLTVNSGETLAITGKSGSGKSTLLHMLGMLDDYDGGEIKYFGNVIDPKQKNINEFRNKSIGFIFQFHYLLSDFTAEENAAMPHFLLSKNYKQSIKKARVLLEKLDIANRAGHYPNQLSGGEQQRVAVARALINDPKIVFADEPTGNLDKDHSNELMNIILDLNQKNDQTFVLVTHDLQIAEKMQSHYRLENGLLQKV